MSYGTIEKIDQFGNPWEDWMDAPPLTPSPSPTELIPTNTPSSTEGAGGVGPSEVYGPPKPPEVYGSPKPPEVYGPPKPVTLVRDRKKGLGVIVHDEFYTVEAFDKILSDPYLSLYVLEGPESASKLVEAELTSINIANMFMAMNFAQVFEQEVRALTSMERIDEVLNTKEGKALDEQGWVGLGELILALKEKKKLENLSISDIEEMIRRSEKKWHEIQNGNIRALYGHSLQEKITLPKRKYILWVVVNYGKIKINYLF